MNQRTVHVGCIFLLGAAINVAVALALALWGPVGAEDRLPKSEAGEQLRSAFGADLVFDGDVYAGFEQHGTGVSIRLIYGVTVADKPWAHVRVEQQAGWPWRALRGYRQVLRGELTFPSAWRVPPDVSDALRVRYDRFVLLGPIWTGFLGNTLLYSMILWLALSAPLCLRRLVRRRQGLCPACAYPAGASPVCTECGKPLAKPRRGLTGRPLRG